MIAVAALGLLLNGGIMLALRRASRHDINVRSAFVHMLGDAVGSIAIIAGALVIRYTGWVRVDPILSIADRRPDRLDRLGHHSRIAQHPAGRPAARHPPAGCDLLHARASKACSTSTICTSGASDRARTL